MAANVNKSWSSFHVSPKGNPNPRNSETSNPMRRSFSGNPFVKPSINTIPKGFVPNTPANSPSDFPPRKSFSGRENVLSFNDNEDKENGTEQNLKQSRIPTPADLKGTKHFMSPTISASCKFTVSPRKKVLMERNESAKTSVSPCDVKTPIRRVTFSETTEEIDYKPEFGGEENKLQASSDMLCRKETSTGPSILEDLKIEVHHSEQPSSTNMEPELLPYDETVTDDPDCVNLDPSFKISPTPPVSNFHLTSEMLSPLDADPSVPPYDPKTNYLSPRPQFLHYRPNPRVELYKEKEGIQLEESFSSSDVEENQSDGSLKESDDFSSQGNEEEEDPVTDLSPRSIEREMKKGSMFTRSKFIVLLLVLSAVGLSISLSILPVSESPAFEDLRLFYKTFDLSDASEAGKAKLGGLARDLNTLSATAMSLFSASVTNFRGAHDSNPFPYCNLTVLLDNSIDGYLTFDHNGGQGMVDSLQFSLQEVNDVEYGTTQEMEIMEDMYTEEDSEYEEQVQGNVGLNDGQEHDEELDVLEVVLEEETIDASRAHFADSTCEELGDVEVVMDDEIGDASRVYFDSTHEGMPQHDETAEPGLGSEETGEASGGFSYFDSTHEGMPQHDETAELGLGSEDTGEASGGFSYFDSTHEGMPQHDETAELGLGSEDTGEASGGFSSSPVFEEKIPQDVASGTVEKGSVALPLEEAIGSSLVPVVELAKSEEFNLENAEVIELSRKEPEKAQENDREVNRQNDLISAAVELQGETKEISSVSTEDMEEQRKLEVGLQPLLMMAVMLLVLPLVAASFYLRTRKDKNLKQTEATSAVQHVSSKKLDFQHVNSTTPDNASVDLPYSRNCTTEVDVVGGTCSSDMSDCEISKTSLFPKASKRPSEVHKNMEKTTKKNSRRESFASSSSEYSTEPSYGSFTTYEKIQIKNGLGDEKKCLTPVRRSSRIRKATSPS